MATYTRTYGSNNDYIAPSDGYSLYVVDGGAGTDTFFADASSRGFTISTMDSNGVTTISGASGTTIKLSNVEKISFKDGRSYTLQTLSSALPTSITGTSGSDQLSGTNGNDTIDGGAGIDTLILNSFSKNSFSLTHGISNWSISSTSTGTDTLTNVERIQFQDTKLALDVDSNALKTLQFIGVIAPSLENNLSVRGSILNLFDQGHSMEQLCQLALDVGLAPTDNTSLATTVYQNVVGGSASQEMTNALVSYIDQHGDANFLATIAGMSINVDLVGLQQSGMEYS